MPPHNLFDSDCQSVSVGQFFNSFLSTSLNTLTPMCNDSAVSPMCNDNPGDVEEEDVIATTSPCNNDTSRMSYPMNHHSMSQTTTTTTSPPSSSTYNSSKARSPRSHHHNAASSSSPSVATNPPVDPRRPPLNPIKPTSSLLNPIKLPKNSFRNRKKVGLSLNTNNTNDDDDDPHVVPLYGGFPPPISCARNVELRRKSLSEQHFFRPVSEDEESVRMGKVNQ
mmetsp:Transcript_4389/g.9584  ORF Transcript_4389/g.9584 Transcript_4389/m.9584 type:complete len:223 (-) Transcript_4389:253-921(-)